jgi:lipopolysaccharide export system protein LptC
MRHRASFFPLVLVATLAGLSYWLQSITEPPGIDRSGRHRHDPDFVVDAFTVRRFDTAGTLQHTLKATQMRHYPDDDTTGVDAPHVVFHGANGAPPTTLTAQEAWVSKDAKSVRLQRNVRLNRGSSDGGAATEVGTERLDVFPDQETASTDTPVTITQGNSVIKGSGLLVDNNAGQTTLLGPVRGIIYRNSGKAP